MHKITSMLFREILSMGMNLYSFTILHQFIWQFCDRCKYAYIHIKFHPLKTFICLQIARGGVLGEMCTHPLIKPSWTTCVVVSMRLVVKVLSSLGCLSLKSHALIPKYSHHFYIAHRLWTHTIIVSIQTVEGTLYKI